ncbi:MAG: SpoIIE family protein phosphatase [Leptospiraceae bacterium]|nr:SpoIIE family protein phosphatase [Leptospiraceae bacterium]MCP5513154.1 SpoIIE family protein phosphatase [Leptospiraceae bacterium]
MKIKHEFIKDLLIITPEGGMDMYTCHEFYDYTINVLSEGSIKRFGINFKSVTSIDSSGIGKLFQISKELEKRNIDRAFYEVPTSILNLFINSGLNQVYRILSYNQFEKEFLKQESIPVKDKLIHMLRRLFREAISHRFALKIAFVILFFVIMISTEILTNLWEKERVEELGSFMKNYLWDIDDGNAKDFSNILLETKGYRRIEIYHPDNSEFLKLENREKPGVFSSFLELLRIIRVSPIQTDIVYNEKNIGTMIVSRVNKNFYTHLLSGFVLFLLYNVISSYIKIVQNRKELNIKNIEINEKMQEVQQLKVQQDGDYFLTALLTKPLGIVKQVSDRFRIDKLIKQKKTFEFRKRVDEIGGDICISDKIRLRGKDYIVFVNADAMGKSLQGAGGVLVFGSAFNSILMRNKNSASTHIQFPEVWLKNVFVDLHKVFESFSGSMLMSTVMGLIDEESGYLYWINAEHPSLILYRDNKAELIDKDIFMKLGTEGVNRTLKIQCTQLFPGDVLIIGSDGRDDIILGKDENGYSIINDDETAILGVIEESNADLQEIYRLLKSRGDLSDDLSLMKIEYVDPKTDHAVDERLESYILQSKKFYSQKKYQECEDLILKSLETYPNSPDLLRLLVRLYFEKKNFNRITNYIEKYLSLKPSDSDFIYLASLSFRKIDNYTMGIAYGERYRLRNPENVRNLLNLHILYHKNADYEKALPILDLILQLEPDNVKALALKGGEYYDDFDI